VADSNRRNVTKPRCMSAFAVGSPVVRLKPMLDINPRLIGANALLDGLPNSVACAQGTYA